MFELSENNRYFFFPEPVNMGYGIEDVYKRQVIGRDAHCLFAVKFRIFECGYTLEMIGHLFGYGV